MEAREPLAFRTTLSGLEPGDLHFETLPSDSQVAGLANRLPSRNWSAQKGGDLGLSDGS